MKAFRALLNRDLLISWRQGSGTLTALLFFLSLTLLIPLALSPDMKLLAKLAPALLWIAALLVMLLALDRIFQADDDDGSLDMLLSSGMPCETLVFAKCLAHWLAHGLPVVLIAPVYGLMLGLEPFQLPRLLLGLIIGTPALTCAGALGAALTLNLRRGNLLLPVIALPLVLPLLIFAALATSSPDTNSAFLIFCALALLLYILTPIATAAALRASRD